MLNLIASGPWSSSQVIAELVPSSRRVVPEIDRIIDATWHEHVRRLGDVLFDGPMCRLDSWRSKSDRLFLDLSKTSYRIFLGTNLCHAELAMQFGREALANAVGMSVALRTADGLLVMGRRNDRVAYYPNRIHPFAGSLEPEDIPNIFSGIQRELTEELELSDREVADLQMLAIIEDQRLCQPEFIFSARTVRNADELRKSLDAAEHDSIWICPASPDSLGNMLNSIDTAGVWGEEVFTPVAVGTLLMFGWHAFGRDWFDAHGAKFVRAA